MLVLPVAGAWEYGGGGSSGISSRAILEIVVRCVRLIMILQDLVGKSDWEM